MKRELTSICVVGISIVLLSACAPATTTPAAEELPEVSVEDLGSDQAILDYDTGTYQLPTDGISLDAPDYVMRVLHAIAVKADECVVEKGYPAVASEVDWAPYKQEEDRTFGRWSTVYASKYGISLVPDGGPPRVDFTSKGPEFNNAYNSCAEAAKDELADVITFSQTQNVVQQIRAKAYQLAISSDDGRAALADWRNCAESAGIVLELESGQPVQSYIDQGKEAEIAAYVTFADCAKSTGAIQQLANARLRFELALMKSQEARIAAFVVERDDAIAKLDAAILG